MKYQVLFAAILFVIVGNIQARPKVYQRIGVSRYVVTRQGFTCSDEGMVELDDSSECQTAITDIHEEIQGAYWRYADSSKYAPTGCYYNPDLGFHNVLWNTDSQGGHCSSCRSICKGSKCAMDECWCTSEGGNSCDFLPCYPDECYDREDCPGNGYSCSETSCSVDSDCPDVKFCVTNKCREIEDMTTVVQKYNANCTQKIMDKISELHAGKNNVVLNLKCPNQSSS